MLPLLTITPLDLIVQWTDVNNKKNPPNLNLLFNTSEVFSLLCHTFSNVSIHCTFIDYLQCGGHHGSW